MVPGRQRGLRGRVLPVLLLTVLWPDLGLAQSAAGVLPWSLPGAAGDEKRKREDKQKRSTPRRARTRAARSASLLPLEGLYGTAYFGFESVGATVGGGAARTHATSFGFNLQGQGHILDPRLCSYSLGAQFDQSGFAAPLQSSSTRGLGLNLNGTFFGSRSFPLRISYTRRSAATTYREPGELQNRFENLALSWSLNQPRIVNVTLVAGLGNGSSDDLAALVPFHERQRNYGITLSRSLAGWSLAANAGYTEVRTSLADFQFVLREQALRLDREIGKRGHLGGYLHHQLRSDSDRDRPSAKYELTAVEGAFTHRHTPKLHGAYNVIFLSNLREAAFASALRSATGTSTASRLQPTPALRQALAVQDSSSSITAQAGWNYETTPRLTLSGGVGHSILRTPAATPEQALVLLNSYTSAAAGIAYRRGFGRWETTWRAGLQHNFNRPMAGDRYADDSRTISVGVRRPVRRWTWTSELAWSDYRSGRASSSLLSERRWSNTFDTRFSRRLSLSVTAQLVHLDSNFSSPRQSSDNRTNGLLLNATLSGHRWNATVGQGLQNVNSAVLTLDLSNPLATAVLADKTPLLTPLGYANRYTYTVGAWQPKRNLTLRGLYRRDQLQFPGGEFNRFTNLDVGFDYRVRLATVSGGLQRLRQETRSGEHSRDRVYVRVSRPFRLR